MKKKALEIAAGKLYITADRFPAFSARGGRTANAAERLMDTS